MIFSRLASATRSSSVAGSLTTVRAADQSSACHAYEYDDSARATVFLRSGYFAYDDAGSADRADPCVESSEVCLDKGFALT